MRRREFITLCGGAAIVWSRTARAQQADRVRLIGVLVGADKDNSEIKARMAAFLRELQRLGWTEGRNVRIDLRASAGDAVAARRLAADLVTLKPDVILAMGSQSVTSLHEATRIVPIVFTLVADPIGAGFVDSLARPGGNTTGFMLFEYTLSAKWLELLKQIAPGVTRAAVPRDPSATAGIGQFAVIQALAPSVGLEIVAINVRDAGEIEAAIKAFAQTPNGGMIVTAGPGSLIHRDLIVALAARYKLPAIYWDRTPGGLISYGADLIEQHRQAAEYVDRILKGEKPGDLPVQAPNKYVLVINLQTAKTLGLTIPPALLAHADEVIE
jgi:putative tryptophan/tyrosine transport system substrate-binding protein